MTLVVNFFAGSGAGKSNLAWDVSAELKWMGGINVEYCDEYVKHQLIEERKAIFQDQCYIFGKQHYKIRRLIVDKLDVIVTDSPILLSAFYNTVNAIKNNKLVDETFNQYVLNEFNKFNNINYFVERVKPFNPFGRFQTAEEAKEDDIKLRKMLDDYKIKYQVIKGEKASTEIIANQIKNMLEYQKQGIAWRS